MVATDSNINQAIAFEDYLTHQDGRDRPQELVDEPLFDLPPPPKCLAQFRRTFRRLGKKVR